MEPTKTLNPYIILGLNTSASEQDIKQAYKRLALKFHPDKNGGDDTQFKRINEAYQMLQDPVKRKMYAVTHETDINSEVFSEIASSFFNMFYQQMEERINSQMKQQKSKGGSKKRKINISIDISLEEIYNAQVKKVLVKVKRKNGYEKVPLYISLLNYQRKYCFQGCGDYDTNRDKMDDIEVSINIVQPQKHFVTINDTICKYDLHMEVPISLYEYYYGFSRGIMYFNDEVLNIKIDGETFQRHMSSNASFVHICNGYGLPYTEDEQAVLRGNLYITFVLKLPELPQDILEENKNFFNLYFNEQET